MRTAAFFSSVSDEWTTPSDTREALDSEFRFTDDPCEVGATDGLLRDWRGVVFVNPPYSNIGAFVQKALVELAARRASLVVMLLPARTDSWWFHDLVLPHGREVRFIRGRLKFSGAKFNAPFASMVVVFE